MKVELTGPDDLGHWFLSDSDGNAYPLVTGFGEQRAAAALFGWKVPLEITNETHITHLAIEYLMDHIGDEIVAPPDAAAYLWEFSEESELDQE